MLRIMLASATLCLVAACGSNGGPCTDDYDCDGIEVCNHSTGRCEKVICAGDQDCLDPRYECIDNRCVLKTPMTPE